MAPVTPTAELGPESDQRLRSLEYIPFGPLGPGVRIGIAILSSNGQLRFGITGGYDTAPDIGVLADGIDAAVATLLRLAVAAAAETATDLTDTAGLSPS